MHFRIVGFIILLFSTSLFAQGRGPAVEDFVGIEVDHPAEVAPQGTEALFNFEQDMNRYEVSKTTAQKRSPQMKARTNQASHPWSLAAIIGFTLILGLPLVSWLVVMGHLRRKATEASATNIKVFEQYRKEREARKAEEVRKAS